MEETVVDIQSIIALVSVITTLLVSIVTPIFSMITRRLELKIHMKQHLVDLYYTEKTDIYKNFLSASSSLAIYIDNGNNFESVLSSAHKVLLFCNEKNKNLLNDFIQFVDARLFSLEKPDYAWRRLYWQKLSAISDSLNDELRDTTSLIEL